MAWGSPNSKKIVASQTIAIKWREYRRVVAQAERTIATKGGEVYWKWRAYKSDDERRKYHVTNAAKFGKEMVEHKAFPESLVSGLDKLRKGELDEPFLLVKGLYPTRQFSYAAKLRDHTGAEPNYHDETIADRLPWFLRQCYYETISSGVIAQLGAVHKAKDVGDQRIYRNYFTARRAVVDQFGNDADVPMRFRNVVPEYLFDDDPKAHVQSLTARFALYVCIENPIEDPLWVLSAERAAALLTPKHRALLGEDIFQLFDHWEENLRQRHKPEQQRILETRSTRTGQINFISFDANRLNIDFNETTVDAREAVSALRHALQVAGAKHAIEVPLERGDVLIVDNYKALVRRTEPKPRPAPWFGPPVRWLRLHCGFPPELAPPVQTRAIKPAPARSVELSAALRNQDKPLSP